MSSKIEEPRRRVVYVDSIRMRHEPRGFTGFANGVALGDTIDVEFYGDVYRVRITRCQTVPSCVTPYIEMEIV